MNQAMFFSSFPASDIQGKAQLGTEKVRQILLSSISMHLFCQNDEGMTHTSGPMYVAKTLGTGRWNGARYILMAPDSKITMEVLAKAIS